MERSNRTPGGNAVWIIAFAIVAAVVGASLAFRGHLSDLVGPLPWFLRTYAVTIGSCEVTAAVLLLMRAQRQRKQRAALLAAAYAFSAPLVLENLITLPGILGLPLAHQTPPWCWTVWHLGWAAFIVLFAWLPDRPLASPLALIGPAFAASLAFGAIAARADLWLPPLLAAGDIVSPVLFEIGSITIGLLLLSAFGLAAFRGATLDAWLLVAVFALALDEAFTLTTSVRFSVGTYLARSLGAINAAAMLLPIAFERRSLEESGARLDRSFR